MEFVWYLIASLVISYALAPKQQRPAPPSLTDLEFPQAEEGTPQMVVFGDVWIKDWTVLWYGDFRTEAIEVKGGKK